MTDQAAQWILFFIPDYFENTYILILILNSVNLLFEFNSAVLWRKVISVIFVIFELGPDLESLCNALPSESISCGIWAFFQPKNCF